MLEHYFILVSAGLFSIAFSMIIYVFSIGLIKTDTIRRVINKIFHVELTSPSPILNRKVFIVYGHNNEKKLETNEVLLRLGLVPVILHEIANEGKTTIEKFEHNSNVGYAVVLLTDDDEGKSKEERQLNKRARQNVVLELGYFFGKLGRKNVCALCSEGVELPSDVVGILHIPLDAFGAWKHKLAKELKSAGFDINLNKLFE